MKFRQLDRIAELIPGDRIKAFRALRADEDYLRDHFPLFPVMPGVLMLEALFQASCWLIRSTEDFGNSLLVLKEAKNVKFADFVEPGQELEINAQIIKIDDNLVSLKASGSKGEIVSVSARLTIEKSNLGTTAPELTDMDAYLRHELRAQLLQLQQLS